MKLAKILEIKYIVQCMVMESSLTSLHIKPKLSFLSIFERLKRVYLEGLEISGQSKIDRKYV